VFGTQIVHLRPLLAAAFTGLKNAPDGNPRAEHDWVLVRYLELPGDAERMDQHPDSPRLARAIAQCRVLSISWSGVVYRSASVRYANRDDLVTGMGARQNPARWNPAPPLQTFAAVYASLEMQTAMEEAVAHQRYYHLPVEKALPRVIAAIQVSLQRVLNLMDRDVLKKLKVRRRQLVDENWRGCNGRGIEALTQAVGRLAWEDDWEEDKRWEALLVPSAADPGGVNLVVFPGNLEPPGSYLLILNPSQLPPPS
jgi:RES domain-containing protein